MTDPLTYRTLTIEPTSADVAISADTEITSFTQLGDYFYLGHEGHPTVNGVEITGPTTRVHKDTLVAESMSWTNPVTLNRPTYSFFSDLSPNSIFFIHNRYIDRWTGAGWDWPYTIGKTHNVVGAKAGLLIDHPTHGEMIVVGGVAGQFQGQHSIRFGATSDAGWSNLASTQASGIVTSLAWCNGTLFIGTTTHAYTWDGTDLSAFYSGAHRRTLFTTHGDWLYFVPSGETELAGVSLDTETVYRYNPQTDVVESLGKQIADNSQWTEQSRFQVINFFDKTWLFVVQSSSSVRLIEIDGDLDLTLDYPNLESMETVDGAVDVLHVTDFDAGVGTVGAFGIPEPPYLLEFDVELIPHTYAPPEEQIRVFAGGEELSDWHYEDGFVVIPEVVPFGEKVVAFRETRTDKSFVEFTGASPIRRTADMMTYFNQRLFILQELCEMKEVAEAIGHPIPQSLFPEEDDSAYSVQVDGDDVNINDLPFPIIHDPIVRPDKQLTVVGVVGDLEIPFEFNPDHEEVSGTEWGIDGDGLIVVDEGWNVEGWPIKVKRVTRLDRYWHSVRDASSFPSTPLIQMSQQLKFLIYQTIIL